MSLRRVRANSVSKASAGGQDEQLCDVNNSITTGRSCAPAAGGAAGMGARPRARWIWIARMRRPRWLDQEAIATVAAVMTRPSCRREEACQTRSKVRHAGFIVCRSAAYRLILSWLIAASPPVVVLDMPDFASVPGWDMPPPACDIA